MSDQWFPDWRIILAIYQLGHSHTFLIMPLLVFCPVQIIMRHPLPPSTYMPMYIFCHLKFCHDRWNHFCKDLNFESWFSWSKMYHFEMNSLIQSIKIGQQHWYWLEPFLHIITKSFLTWLFWQGEWSWKKHIL